MLSNSAGQFVDASALLPQSFAYTHDLSSGVIDSAGDKAIFFNNVYSQPNTPLWYVIANGTGAARSSAREHRGRINSRCSFNHTHNFGGSASSRFPDQYARESQNYAECG